MTDLNASLLHRKRPLRIEIGLPTGPFFLYPLSVRPCHCPVTKQMELLKEIAQNTNGE